MASITTRSGKGSALTFTEMDANFTNLNTAKLENTTDDFTGTLSVKGSGDTTRGNVAFYDQDDSNYLALQAPTTLAANVTFTLPEADGSDGQVLKTDGSGNLSFVDQSGGGGSTTFVALTDTPANFTGAASKFVKVNSGASALEFVAVSPLENVSEDTTPQLGGDLDVNGNDIVSVSAGNIAIAPDSANSEGYSTGTLDASSGHFKLKTGLVLDHPGSTGLDAQYSNYITTATTNGDLNLATNGSGKIRPRADLQVRNKDGSDLIIRSDSKDSPSDPDGQYAAKIQLNGGSSEEGYIQIDKDNQEVEFYTDTYDLILKSDEGQTKIQNYGGNIEIRSRDSNNSSKGNVIVRADTKIEITAGEDLDSNGDCLISSYDDFQFRKIGFASTDTDLTPTTNSSTSVVLGRALTDGEQNAFDNFALFFLDADPDTANLRDMSLYREVDSDTEITGSGATTTITLYDPIENLSDTTHAAAKFLMFKSKSPAIIVDGTRGRLEDKTLNIQNRIGQEGPVGCRLKFEAIEFHDGEEFLGTGTGESDFGEESPVTYELFTEADKNTLKLEHSTVTDGSSTTTDVLEVRHRTTTSSTVASKNTPEVVEFHLNPQVQSFTKAELDAITGRTGEIAMCSNGNAGAPCLAFYSGSAWLNASGAALSTT